MYQKIIKFSRCHSLIVLGSALIIGAINAMGQSNWKGFDLTRTTDAFTQEIPAGINCLIVETYGATKRFGHEISTGKLKETTTYEFDDNGYYINDGKKTYENTYSDDGLIQSRDVFENGKFVERWIYKYVDDEKGPGVVLMKYDSDGEPTGNYEAWQGNLHTSGGGGGEVTYKLNNAGQAVSGTIIVTNYRQKVEINQTIDYNDHGFMESSTLIAPGKSQVTNYSDYVYDDNDQWIERYSDRTLTKRKILSKEEYAQLLERQRIEAERKRLAKIAEETQEVKREIERRKYALTDELKSGVSANIELNEIALQRPIDFEMIIPSYETTISYPGLFNINVVKPAQYEFPNDSIGNVPSQFIGVLESKWLRNKKFAKPIEIKIDLNKVTNEWYVKDTENLMSKHNLSKDEVDALSKFVCNSGSANAFKSKKLYLSEILQLCVTLSSRPKSALVCTETETYPIRFNISETKPK